MLTGSSFQVGLIGLVELVPLVVVALLGGTLADRTDRRRLLLAAQLVQAATSVCLVIGAAAGSPPVALLYLIAAVASGASAVDRPTRAAMVPALVGPERLRSAISFSYGLVQVAMVVGPAVGGIVIAVAGLTWAYGLDVATFVAMIAAVWAMASPPRPPVEPGRLVSGGGPRRPPVRGPQRRAHGELRNRHPRDDIWHAARALPGARPHRLRRRPRGPRRAVRGGLRGRCRRRVLDRLDDPRAQAGPDRRRSRSPSGASGSRCSASRRSSGSARRACSSPGPQTA